LQDYTNETIPQPRNASGRAFTIALRNSLRFRSPRPSIATGRREGLSFRGAPYLVFYVIDGDVIKIEQVRHAAQQS